MARRRTATATSHFGSGKRESHDSSSFYERFTAPVVSPDERVADPVAVDVIFHADAREITDDMVADRSVALMVTSPPYFAGKEYETDLAAGHVPSSYVEYLEMLTDAFAVCLRKLEPGGRMAINVANLGRKPYRSLSADVIAILKASAVPFVTVDTPPSGDAIPKKIEDVGAAVGLSDKAKALAAETKAGLDLHNPALAVAVDKQQNGYARMSLTISALLHSRLILLAISGRPKRTVALQALAGTGNTPIATLLSHRKDDLEFLWTE